MYDGDDGINTVVQMQIKSVMVYCMIVVKK